MKTFSASLQTHIDLQVTTLAYCIKFTTIAGTTLFFSNHDKDITVSGDIYVSASGYDRTNIANSGNLAIDNTDIVGIFDNAGIKQQDLKSGAYDYADYEIFLVNYTAPDDGIIKIKKGRMGRVSLTTNGTFSVTLEGLSKQLIQNIVELTSPNDRADLGDSRNKTPINPDIRQDATDYALGDYIRVSTDLLASGYEIYENRIYECTTAGTSASGSPLPTFDTIVGNTTTDGTAIFTAREAWTRHGQVDTVTSNREITVTITDPLAVDDWYNFGVLQWDTGNNSGLSMEVKDCAFSGSPTTITLFIPMKNDIQVGDLFHVQPGYDKTLSQITDRFSNAINMRAEPYVPGPDEYSKFPDAR